MRSNSGRDKARNNMHDPTIRDRMMGHDLKKNPTSGQSTGMGSHARKGRKHGRSRG